MDVLKGHFIPTYPAQARQLQGTLGGDLMLGNYKAAYMYRRRTTTLLQVVPPLTDGKSHRGSQPQSLIRADFADEQQHHHKHLASGSTCQLHCTYLHLRD